MLFSTVATIFAQIENESARTRITEYLATLFAEVGVGEASFLAYFCLGELYPSYYNKNLNMAEKTVMRALARLYGLPVEEVGSAVKEVGDVGTYVLEQHGQGGGAGLSVAAVRDALHEMLAVAGAGSQDLKEGLLLALLRQVSGREACYIVRSVVGTLRLGFSDMTMLDAYSWMASGSKKIKPALENAYNVSADIGHVLVLLKTGGLVAVNEAGMVPGVPVRPAAADRLADSRAVFDKLGPCVAQPKLDGFRLQIHRWRAADGSLQTRFFSRNLHDMSAMFPDLVVALGDLAADSVIMEGEAIVHNPATGHFMPFQETVKRKRKHGVDEAAAELPLTLYLFDILFLNGQNVLDCSHAQRRRLLTQLVPGEGVVRTIEEVSIAAESDLALYFEHAMSAGLEGIVVKNAQAVYQPGKRNSNWIKLKRQERGELADTIDCVILGYYAGAGKRTQFGIGAFLVGVYNPDLDRFETIARIGTGLSDDEWRALRGRCEQSIVSAQPHNVICEASVSPDVWVAPAIVCSVRADDITRSPMHTAGRTRTTPGYALRFPRIMGYRPDKDALQATQVAEIETLYTLQDLKHKQAS